MRALLALGGVLWALAGCATVGVPFEEDLVEAHRQKFEAALRAPQQVSLEERRALYEEGKITGSLGWSQWGEEMDTDALAELSKRWGSKEAPGLFEESQRLRQDPGYYLVFEGLGLVAGGAVTYLGTQALIASIHSIGDILNPIFAIPLAAASLGLGIGGGVLLSRWVEGPARDERLEKARRLEEEGVTAMNAALYGRLMEPGAPDLAAAQAMTATAQADDVAVDDPRTTYAVIGAGLSAALAYGIIAATGGQTNAGISYGSATLGGIVGWIWGSKVKKDPPLLPQKASE